MQEIIIEIGPNGEVTVEGKGIVGAECTSLTKAIEEALGDVEKRELKPEYRQAAPKLRKAGL